MMRTLAYLAVLLALTACGPEDQPPETCATDSRQRSYTAGLEVVSGAGMFKARWAQATPAPPDREINTWMLEILDLNGSPLTDVSKVRVKAWMPDHGHGTNPLWNEGAAQPDGKFEVGPFNLFMPGLWEFTISVEAQNQTDTAMVAFCIVG